jgi:segregation and condensation protein B
MDQKKLKSIVESVLFISGEPVKIAKLAKVTGVGAEEISAAILELQKDYLADRGLIIITKEDFVQMATNPENSSFVSDLIKSEMQESLSRSALEVLSIIAYRGPIARSGVEAIRGVNSSFTIRSLLLRGLVERIENPKDSRGYIYKISFDFLKKLGIDSIQKLPDYESLSRDDRIDNVLGEESAGESEKTESEE